MKRVKVVRWRNKNGKVLNARKTDGMELCLLVSAARLTTRGPTRYLVPSRLCYASAEVSLTPSKLLYILF